MRRQRSEDRGQRSGAIGLQDRYHWEAEQKDGAIITRGEDLTGCVRFSLIPASGLMLPRHDVIGLELVRRFNRGFIKTHLGTDRLPGKFFWQNGSNVLLSEMDVSDRLQPGNLISKGVAGEPWYLVRSVHGKKIILHKPYEGNSKPRGMQAKRQVLHKSAEYLFCLVTKVSRLYVRASDGAALVGPADYELYL